MGDITNYDRELRAIYYKPYVKGKYAETIDGLDKLAQDYKVQNGAVKKGKAMLLPVVSGLAVGGLYALGDDSLADSMQQGFLYGAGFSVANTFLEAGLCKLNSYAHNFFDKSSKYDKNELSKDYILAQVRGNLPPEHDLKKNPLATGAIYGIEGLLAGIDTCFSAGIGAMNGGCRFLYGLKKTPLQKHLDEISDATSSERFAIAGALVKRWHDV
mgnify:CR=1 FL=1